MFIVKRFVNIISLLLVAFPLRMAAQENTALQDSINRLLVIQPGDTVKVNLLNKLAHSWLNNNQDSAMKLAKTSIALAEQLQYPKGKGIALVNMAICYRLKGNYSNALQNCLEGARLLEAAKAGSAMADACLQLAQIYKDMSGASQTEEYLTRGIAYGKESAAWAQRVQDTAGIVYSLNMLGVLYRDKGKEYAKVNYYETAFDAYTKAMTLITATGKGADARGRLYNNISQVYLEHKKDIHTGLVYLFKAVAFNKNNHNIASLSFNYGNIAAAYNSLQDHANSLLYARKMLDAGLLLKRPERIQNAYNQLYRSFLGAGQTDSALKYYVLADQLDDSLTNIRKTQQVMELQTKYETAKKEAEINRLQTESGNKNKRISILIAAVALFALLAGGLLWLYQRVKKQRQQITEQSGRLEVMMKELHHRVKNNLQIVSSLLSLQAYKLQDAEAISVLRESQLRVQAMSFIHQRHYKKDALTAVNMREYLTDLAESLLSSYGYHRDDFDLQVTVTKEMLDIDKALPIGLIINEMVTNALKYAYPSVARPGLTIMLTENTHHLVCLVKDNGIGMDENSWKQKNSSFGRQLISALCKQLRAEQTLVVSGGTQFTITIPKQAA